MHFIGNPGKSVTSSFVEVLFLCCFEVVVILIRAILHGHNCEKFHDINGEGIVFDCLLINSLTPQMPLDAPQLMNKNHLTPRDQCRLNKYAPLVTSIMSTALATCHTS